MKLLGKGIKLLFENWIIQLRMALYVFFVLMAVIGAVMTFTGAPEAGILLIVLNVLFVFLCYRHDKKVLAEQAQEYEQEILKNRGGKE
ncbi:MAG: hypothetical protein ACI4OJ_02340 [Lachnospiraceae bacterium]